MERVREAIKPILMWDGDRLDMNLTRDEITAMAPPSREDCMECLADSLRRAGKAFTTEQTRLREVIQTLHVNALHATEPGPLVDFMRDQLGKILAGKTLSDAVRDFEATRKGDLT